MTKTISKQGQQATFNGAMLEKQIATSLIHHNYAELTRDEIKLLNHTKNPDLITRPKWFVTQTSLFSSIYNTRMTSDFYVKGDTRWKNGLIIESKWQGVGGSVDEKFPFTVLSLKQAVKESPYAGTAMLIIGGTGVRGCAREWIRSQETPRGHFLFFDGFEAFMHWASKNL